MSQNPDSFLVVRLGAIGDALRVCPAVRRLRRAFPDARIGWAVEDWVYPVVSANANVDRFHVVKRGALRKGGLAALGELRRIGHEMRAEGYEVTLDFHGRFRSGLITRAARSPRRIGYVAGQSSEMSHLFTNERVKLEDSEESRVLRFLHLLDPLEIDTAFDPDDLGIYVSDDEIRKAEAWYEGEGRPRLAAFPGCSGGRSGFLRWPAENWVELLNRLGDDGARTVLFWGPDELEFTEDIASRAGDGCRLAPKTALDEMMAMIGRFGAFIGSNTAAMHMAWLQGVPTVEFSGPMPARTDAPLPPVPSRVLRADAYYREGVKRKHQPDVVAQVTVDEAYDAVASLLEEACRPKKSQGSTC